MLQKIKYSNILIFFFTLMVISCKNNSENKYNLVVHNLRCEFLKNPKGVDKKQPYFSWELDAPGQENINQSSYRIFLYSFSKEHKDSLDLIWDSKKIKSKNSVNIKYTGPALESACKYFWRTQVTDMNGAISSFSEMASFETGILNDADWKAEWIYCPGLDTGNCPLLIHEFILDQVPDYAPSFVASLGFHELYVNGEKVSDAVLTPSVSDLRKRVLYSSYDIASKLVKGKNTVTLWLAPGWTDFSDKNPVVSFDIKKKPACKAQFKIGKDKWLATDMHWKYLHSNTYHIGKWQNSNFGGDSVLSSSLEKEIMPSIDYRLRRAVESFSADQKISSDLIEPNRMVKKIIPVSVRQTGKNKYQFRMDKIYTGWIEAEVKGRPGKNIIISLSSYPDKDVEFNQRNVLVIGKNGKGIFRNRFSYHQIEYVTIEGLDYQPALHDVRGFQVTNDRETLGGFECSDTLINQIYRNTCYTYESLCTGGMTVDCPHRERLGYGGDGHGSLDIALDAFASHSFFTKWTQDWIDIQDDNGRINHTAPTIGGGGGPAWSGFILAMPWEVYLNYGDIRILEMSFPAINKWLGYLENHIGDNGLLNSVSPGNWNYMKGGKWLFLGDWATPYENEASDSREALLFNNCYFVYVLNTASKIAAILKEGQKAKEYKKLALKISEAVNKNFYDSKNHTYIDTKQTHLVMPLIAGIVPKEAIAAVEKNLEHEILVNQKGHFATGLHGTWFLTKYLTEKKRNDLLYILSSKRTFPSYGEIIARGEITWPEFWFKTNSRVHGCLNGIGGWFQRGLLGVCTDPESPGYKSFIIKPAYSDSIQWAKGYHISPYGRIDVSWKRNNIGMELEIDIPENTSAKIYFPKKEKKNITINSLPLTECKNIKITGLDDKNMIMQIGSGHYLIR